MLTVKRAKGVKVAKVNQRKRFTNLILFKKKKELHRIRKKKEKVNFSCSTISLLCPEGIFIHTILPGAFISTVK